MFINRIAVAGVALFPVCLAAQGNLVVSVIPQDEAGRAAGARDGFVVCVGTAADTDSRGRATTNSSGIATFSGLAAGGVTVTASKAGYVGQQRAAAVVNRTTMSVPMFLRAGRGGTGCGLATVKQPATSGVAIPGTDPVYSVARLGEQTLAARGTYFSEPHHPTYDHLVDCGAFGESWSIVGVDGTHGQAVMRIRLVCGQIRTTGTWTTTKITTPMHPTGLYGQGEAFNQTCGADEVITRMMGTINQGQVRSLQFQCSKLGARGLTTGSFSKTLATIGKISGSAFGPDACSGGRPARALKFASGHLAKTDYGLAFVAPPIISAFQLICEQPEAVP